MKKLNLFKTLIMMCTVLFTSCALPSFMRMESARMLQEGHIAASLSYSSYPFYSDVFPQSAYSSSLAYGITPKISSKIRYSYLSVHNKWEVFSEVDNYNLHMIELSGKYELIKKYVAIESAYQNYMKNGQSLGYFQVMSHCTLPYKNYFEITASPGLISHVDTKLIIYPMVTIGLGVSTDLNKWALRLEANSFFEVGLGLSYNFPF